MVLTAAELEKKMGHSRYPAKTLSKRDFLQGLLNTGKNAVSTIDYLFMEVSPTLYRPH